MKAGAACPTVSVAIVRAEIERAELRAALAKNMHWLVWITGWQQRGVCVEFV